jgi:hypothetical protein
VETSSFYSGFHLKSDRAEPQRGPVSLPKLPELPKIAGILKFWRFLAAVAMLAILDL